jgi:hypothetical protein
VPSLLPPSPFSPSFPPSLHTAAEQEQRGKDPQLAERPIGTRLLGLWVCVGQGSQGTTWGKVVPPPLPWRRRRSARAGLRAEIARGKGVNRGKGGVWASLGMRANCPACAPARPAAWPGVRARVERRGSRCDGTRSGQRGRKKNRGGPHAGPSWR